MNVLLTGVHGFIGSHLCEYLLTKGCHVRGVVSPWGSLSNLSAVLGHKHLELVRADITDAESLRGLAKGIDTVFHCAARVADWGTWQTFYDSNVLATEYLVKEAERERVKRLVFLSSIAVHAYTGFQDADTRKLPRNNTNFFYARSKIFAEDVLKASALETVIVRPGLWVFGSRDPNLGRVVKALQSGGFPLINGGRAVINTCYAENLVLGMYLAATVPDAAHKTYLIADEGKVTWLEVFKELTRLVGAPRPRLSLPAGVVKPFAGIEAIWRGLAPRREPPLTRYRAGLMAKDVHFSVRAVQEELGYKAPFSWREGLVKSV